jgi:hypothetical protein
VALPVGRLGVAVVAVTVAGVGAVPRAHTDVTATPRVHVGAMSASTTLLGTRTTPHDPDG